jgi:hypothetical protein
VCRAGLADIGNLAIEIGKIANQIAVKFHQLATKENELFQYLETYQGFEPLALRPCAPLHGRLALPVRAPAQRVAVVEDRLVEAEEAARRGPCAPACTAQEKGWADLTPW